MRSPSPRRMAAICAQWGGQCDLYRSIQMAQLMIRPHSSSPNETATTGTVETTNRGRDRARAQRQRPALLLEAQVASARVACGGCWRNSSQRTGSAGGGRIQGWIEGVMAYASCLSSSDRSGGYGPVGGWSGGRQERRDLESNAIEPLACFGSLLRGFWPQVLDLAGCHGKPAAHFDLSGFKTRLRVARARGVLRAQCLRRARLDTRFLGVRILSNVPRHPAHLGALRALLLGDGSDGRVKV